MKLERSREETRVMRVFFIVILLLAMILIESPRWRALAWFQAIRRDKLTMTEGAHR